MLTDLPLDSSASGNPPSPAGTTMLWDAAMDILSRKLSAQNFDLWFRPIRCQRIDGAHIHLIALNQFIKEWFETHYQSRPRRDWRIERSPLHHPLGN